MQKLWHNLQLSIKLFLIFFGTSAITAFILAFSLYNQIRTDYYELLRHDLVSIAAITATRIDGDRLAELTLPSQEASPDYLAIKQQLAKIRAETTIIKYIYTLRQTDDPRYLAFIVDADHDNPARLGELYDTAATPAMITAFSHPSAENRPIEDKWGSTLSGYAPVRDLQGNIVAIVGVDITTDQIVEELGEYRQETIRYTLLCITIAAFISFILAEGLTSRLQKINRAVDEIASGNLNIDIKVDGIDEVANLATRINHMAAALSSDREIMLYSTIKSLIATIEAKDSYTYGHSSEVAAITSDICRELALPEADAFNINLAALLHDIGKIGVPDHILNKQGSLTDKEWLQIKQHPAIGAKIIADIPALKEVAKIVLHHHARWDGNGYPTGIKGTSIPLGARIIAVADSFQAMISDRSYRRGIPVARALAEIKKCSGTQFDPKVVAAFLKTRYSNEFEPEYRFPLA